MKTQTIKQIVFGACLVGSLYTAHAQSVNQVGDVFYIELENHNWTQPAGEGTYTSVPSAGNANSGVASGSGFTALFNNPAAPYLNSLIAPTVAGTFTNPAQAVDSQSGVSYCSDYHAVLSSTTNGPIPVPTSIHPSEPNYIWQEAGNNIGQLNDNDPIIAGVTNANSTPTEIANYNTYGTTNSASARIAMANYYSSHPGVSTNSLTGLIQSKGISWKSYQEDIDLTTASGSVNQPGANAITGSVAPTNQWTVPLASFSGTATNGYTNPYYHTGQYNFAAKHDGQLFFASTSGSPTTNNFSNSNPEVGHYAPLQQLSNDLANNAVGSYNLITPNQFNDMHTALNTTFTYNGIPWKSGSDGNRIAVGDNFLSIVVPEIMQSAAYQSNGTIVIWTDETEGTSQNDFNHTLCEIVISRLAEGTQVTGDVYDSTNDFTHSSDIATLQNLYQIPDPSSASGYLNDAVNGTADGSTNINSLFVSGAVPSAVPEPATYALFGLGALVLVVAYRRRRA